MDKARTCAIAGAAAVTLGVLLAACCLAAGPASAEATKRAEPAVCKQVKGSAGTWGDADEAACGQRVSYRVRATLPADASAYGRLPFKIVDELPRGMSVDEGSVRIAARPSGGPEADIGGLCEVAFPPGELVVDVGRGDALAMLGAGANGAEVTVSYEAALTSASAAGAAGGNPNLAHVEYPDSPTSGEMVSSERAVARLFTWKVRVVRRCGGRGLPGSGFSFEDAAGTPVGTGATGGDGTVEFPSVPSGSYLLAEREAPAGHSPSPDTSVHIDAELGRAGSDATLSARASGAGRVESVDARSGIVTIAVSDDHAAPVAGGTAGTAGGRVPDTGDGKATALAVSAAASATGLLFAALLRARRAEGNDPAPGTGRNATRR